MTVWLFQLSKLFATMSATAKKVRKKKAKLIVTNLSTALNPDNYDPIEQPSTPRKLTGFAPSMLMHIATVIRPSECAFDLLFNMQYQNMVCANVLTFIPGHKFAFSTMHEQAAVDR